MAMQCLTIRAVSGSPFIVNNWLKVAKSANGLVGDCWDMGETDRLIQRAVAEMCARMDRMMFTAIGGQSTTSPAATESTLDVSKAIRDWGKLLRQARRTQVTFVVEMGYLGAPIVQETPCDGTRIELSYLDAAQIHRQWPLKLHKVISPDVAEFTPVSGVFPEYVPARLQAPPYEMPPVQTFEEWAKTPLPPETESDETR